MGEVGDKLIAFEDLRPHGDGEHRILAASAVRKTSSAYAASTSPELLVGTEPGEVAPPRIGDDHHVPPVSAVATVRPPTRYVLLSPEMNRAVAATPRDGRQARPVVEHELLRVDD
jgi:hypothetical protein